MSDKSDVRMCSGTNKDGSPCGNKAKHGSDFCSVHLKKERAAVKKVKKEEKKISKKKSKGPRIEIPSTVECSSAMCGHAEVSSESVMVINGVGVEKAFERLNRKKNGPLKDAVIRVVQGIDQLVRSGEVVSLCPTCRTKIEQNVGVQEGALFRPYAQVYRQYKINELRRQEKIDRENAERKVQEDEARRKLEEEHQAQENQQLKELASFGFGTVDQKVEDLKCSWIQDCIAGRLTNRELRYLEMKKIKSDDVLKCSNPHCSREATMDEQERGSNGRERYVMRLFFTKALRAYFLDDGQVHIMGGSESRKVNVCANCAEIVTEEHPQSIRPKAFLFDWERDMGIERKQFKPLLQVPCQNHPDRWSSRNTRLKRNEGDNPYQALKQHALCGACARESEERTFPIGETINMLGKVLEVLSFQQMEGCELVCREEGCEHHAGYNDKIDVDFRECTDEDLANSVLCEEHAIELARSRGFDEPAEEGSNVYPLQYALAMIYMAKRQKEEKGDTSSSNGNGKPHPKKKGDMGKMGDHNGNGKALQELQGSLPDRPSRRGRGGDGMKANPNS